MNFTYFMPTKILFGAGELDKLHTQKLPGKKACIVISSGKSMRENGYLRRVQEQLRLAGVDSAVFDKILPNPILKHVEEGAEFVRQNSCDFLVGLGGGSSIDSAKAIAVAAKNDGKYWDYIHGGSGGGKPIPNDPLPVVAIPTTAGTGTEADPWTVVTKTETSEKIGFGYDKTFPVLSVIDPTLMLSVTRELTLYQGFDTLFHSTEGYLHASASDMSDMFALKAIGLVFKYLPTAANDGSDLEARANIAFACMLAGIVETVSGCTASHSMAHALGAYNHKLPHGAALIAISDAYYSRIAKSGLRTGRLGDMAKAADGGSDFVAALAGLRKKCGVDTLKLANFGIASSDARKYADNAFETMGGLIANDPYPYTPEICAEVIAES